MRNVKLNVEHHFYYDVDDGRRFPSVTSSLLKMVKEDFNGIEVRENIIKSYETFHKWYMMFENVNPKEYNELISLYYTYKNYRPFVIAQGFNGTYEKRKKIKEYNSKDILRRELVSLKMSNPEVNPSKVYIWDMFNHMSDDDISNLWQQLTDIANIFGTMVHEICEEWFCKKYQNDFYTIAELQLNVSEGWRLLEKKIKDNVRKYPLNKWHFEQYIVQMSLKEFKKHVINSFLSLNPDLGIQCVSEKILGMSEYYVYGTIDTLIDLNPTQFDINDHKTNKEFTREKDTKLLEPFNDLDDSDYNVYSLQTSVYSKIHEICTGKKLRNIWISYFNRKNLSFEKIDLEYKPDIAMQLLEMHREHINKLRHQWKKYEPVTWVNKKHKTHLITLLYKKSNELKLQGLGRGLINEELRKFVKEDYLTWQNI